MYRDKNACARHDKDVSDQILQGNLNTWISAKSWPVLRALRMYRATSYYIAVHDGGDSAFWGDGKEGR